MLVDSHCHLYMLDLTAHQGSLDNLMATTRQQGIQHLLCVAVDLASVAQVIAIAERYPDVSASVGIHPNEQDDPTVEELLALAKHDKVVAIGETGLDYYRGEENKVLQQARFRRHIQVAKIVKKPLIIHTRQARADTIRILQEEGAAEIGGVMHCFTEDWAMAQQALALNFYISFSGIVTFRNAVELQEIAKQVPLERMLIETDAPFLAPIPMRGKTNEPAYVRYVAEYIAKLRDISFATIAAQTTENFFTLFKHAHHKGQL